jgi:hypothetical protein
VQQRAGILQHDPRLLALGEQLGDELPHPLVAPVEHRRVVVVAQVRMLQHPLQVADDGGGAQVGSPGGDEGLVHVQGDRECAVDAGDIDRGATEEQRLLLPGGDRRLDPRLRAAQVRQVIDVLGKVSHCPPRQAGFCPARVQARRLPADRVWCGLPPGRYGGCIRCRDRPNGR